MAHQHGHAHLERRQRVATVIHEDVQTADNTFAGDVVWVTETADPTPAAAKTLIPAAVRTRPSSTDDDDSETTTKTSATKKPSATHTSNALETDSSTKKASTLMVATKTPTPNAASTATAGLASATAVISSATASSSPDSASGMSSGAKAGIALAILLSLCALLTAILLLYRRKKKQTAAANAENEKIDMYNAPPPPPPQTHATAPSIHTNRTLSTAPRLSLRPVTQFDPTFSEQRKSAGNLLTVAAAGGAAGGAAGAAAGAAAQLQNRDHSAASTAPSGNPFNDPEARSGPPSANPFGNSAALDAQFTGLPDSPPNASPMHSTQPSKDFANPAPAIAAANVGPVELPGATSSLPVAEFPAPPPMTANATSVPPSPAWTEDFPASPGPAPTGPPPVAGAMTGGRPQSPAPGADNVHRVQLDFKASMQDELDLHSGQLVRMLHEYDDGWVCPLPYAAKTTILT